MKRLFKIGQRVRVHPLAYCGDCLRGRVGIVVAYHKERDADAWALVAFPHLHLSFDGHAGIGLESRRVPQKYVGKCWYIPEHELSAWGRSAT